MTPRRDAFGSRSAEPQNISSAAPLSQSEVCCDILSVHVGIKLKVGYSCYWMFWSQMDKNLISWNVWNSVRPQCVNVLKTNQKIENLKSFKGSNKLFLLQLKGIKWKVSDLQSQDKVCDPLEVQSMGEDWRFGLKWPRPIKNVLVLSLLF